MYVFLEGYENTKKKKGKGKGKKTKARKIRRRGSLKKQTRFTAPYFLSFPFKTLRKIVPFFSLEEGKISFLDAKTVSFS